MAVDTTAVNRTILRKWNKIDMVERQNKTRVWNITH